MSTVYLDVELMEKMCHPLAVAIFDSTENPIPPFQKHSRALLESALGNPQQTYGGTELYPTIVDKATILYYSLSKNHSFENGNKRVATASLLVFLHINKAWLTVNDEALADFTLKVADSAPQDRQAIIAEIKQFIVQHLIEEEQ